MTTADYDKLIAQFVNYLYSKYLNKNILLSFKEWDSQSVFCYRILNDIFRQCYSTGILNVKTSCWLYLKLRLKKKIISNSRLKGQKCVYISADTLIRNFTFANDLDFDYTMDIIKALVKEYYNEYEI